MAHFLVVFDLFNTLTTVFECQTESFVTIPKETHLVESDEPETSLIIHGFQLRLISQLVFQAALTSLFSHP